MCYHVPYISIYILIYGLIVCFDIKTHAKNDVTILRWTFGSCSSSGGYRNNNTYLERCCVSSGKHTLTCYNTKAPEGWKGSYLEIGKHKFCDDFMDYRVMSRIDAQGILITCQKCDYQFQLFYSHVSC